MEKCETCGNEYDKMMLIKKEGVSHHFDSFECAIHAMAPHCWHCDCRIIGHGMEANGKTFCCASCSAEEGEMRLVDRSDSFTQDTFLSS